MTYRRLEANRLLELVRLHRLGISARETTRLLGMGPNTERRYREALGCAGLLQGPPEALPSSETVRDAVTAALPPRRGHRPSSSVEPWRARVEALVEKGLSPRAVFDRLRLSTRDGESAPFRASYTAVKRFCRQLRRERGDTRHVAIPVDSAPGECCQVDPNGGGPLVGLTVVQGSTPPGSVLSREPSAGPLFRPSLMLVGERWPCRVRTWKGPPSWVAPSSIARWS